ncbi:hypothetical protein DXV65_17130 [Pseudomonas fluorescens]|nr:hypothetical protein DXV65_17130 [Pseudomonas fluorescens]
MHPKCGSWLACDSGISVTLAIAGKPAPTGGPDLQLRKARRRTLPTVVFGNSVVRNSTYFGIL